MKFKEECPIQIKKIKLSPKKGGNGFVSSFSVNIGSQEARECGLLYGDEDNQVVVKIIDSVKKQIVIKAKEYTLTDDIINEAIRYSELSRKLNHDMAKSLPSYSEPVPGAYAVDLFDIPLPGFDTDNEYANKLHELEQEFERYLLKLPLETITDLMTLMYMGRGQDANMSLPSLERFLDYWVYLSDIGCFSAAPDELVSQIAEKAPLAEYLQRGLDILWREPREESDEEDEDYDEY